MRCFLFHAAAAGGACAQRQGLICDEAILTLINAKDAEVAILPV
jgi:hypothetical protein